MFYSCSLNNKINRLHERCLRIIYNDKRSNFYTLNNITALAIELYKVANDMSSEIMSEVFKLRDTLCYNLRDTWKYSTNPIHSVYHGNEPASHLGANTC